MYNTIYSFHFPDQKVSHNDAIFVEISYIIVAQFNGPLSLTYMGKVWNG
jgi:hypothetical protein